MQELGWQTPADRSLRTRSGYGQRLMHGRRYDPVKRAIDLVGGAVGLVLLAPVLAVIGALVRWKMGAPVIFTQRRAGQDGELFTLYKFRTMRPGAEPDEERITPLGEVLRASSLDELPELVNVIRGDMSLVGPRPLLARYLPRFEGVQTRRHEVRPGLTGLAQVNGHDDERWDDRLADDVRYVDERSLGLDLWILARTVITVLRRPVAS